MPFQFLLSSVVPVYFLGAAVSPPYRSSVSFVSMMELVTLLSGCAFGFLALLGSVFLSATSVSCGSLLFFVSSFAGAVGSCPTSFGTGTAASMRAPCSSFKWPILWCLLLCFKLIFVWLFTLFGVSI